MPEPFPAEDRVDDAAWPQRPGALLQLFGGAAAPIFGLARRDPALAARLLALDLGQLHLLAFALAHEPAGPGRATAAAAGGAPAGDVLRSLGLGAIAGLDTLLRRLPYPLLAPGDYRRMVGLLTEPETGTVLARAATLDRRSILNIASLPPRLRTWPIATALAGRAEGPALLLQWIELVAARHAFASTEPVIASLAAARSPRGLGVRIARIYANLPLPEPQPGRVIGDACRLDSPADVRRLAQPFADRLTAHDIEAGATLWYLWRHPERPPVVCVLSRLCRYGWMVSGYLGAHNTSPPDDVMRDIEVDFRRAGFHPHRVAMFAAELSIRRRRANPPMRDDDVPF